jgi:hypothetical protein
MILRSIQRNKNDGRFLQLITFGRKRPREVHRRTLKHNEVCPEIIRGFPLIRQAGSAVETSVGSLRSVTNRFFVFQSLLRGISKIALAGPRGNAPPCSTLTTWRIYLSAMTPINKYMYGIQRNQTYASFSRL